MSGEGRAERNEDAARVRSPGSLTAERIGAHWKAMWRHWRTALDWTVLLYILIPGVWIAGGYYVDLVRHPPEWFALVPTFAGVAVPAIAAGGGRLRTFAERGDGLFLYRNRRWRNALLFGGLAHSFGLKLVAATLAVVVMLPWWLGHYRADGLELALLVLLAATAGTAGKLLRDVGVRRSRAAARWAFRLLVSPTWLLLTIALLTAGLDRPRAFALLAVVGIAAALLLARRRSRATGTLPYDLNAENEAVMSGIGWLLKDAYERRPVPKLRKPMLWSRSQYVFRDRTTHLRIAESWMKSVLRRRELLQTFASFASAGTAAMLLSPVPLAAGVWLALPMLLLGWLRRIWEQWLSEDYVALFGWNGPDLNKALAAAQLRLAFPIALLWLAVVGVRAGLAYGWPGWIGLAAAPPIAWFWTKQLGELFASFAGKRMRRGGGGDANRDERSLSDPKEDDNR